MASGNQSRRKFLKQNSIAGLGMALAPTLVPSLTKAAVGTDATPFILPSSNDAPALLGGPSAWAPVRWPKWPIWDKETDETQLLEVMRSGVWSRAGVVTEFEKKWAEALGVKRCLAVVNGTNALTAAVLQFGIGIGDEVLVPPYTFISTITAILSNGAMPVFVDIDPATYQIDPAKIEAKITSRTKAILPVHILGMPADMPRIMAIAKKHKLIVIEDACQAHLSEINHQKVGTIGDAGCFSFQNSKNLPIGEGGAIVSNDDAFMDKCFSYTNLGTAYGTAAGSIGVGSIRQGTKIRFTEYQAAIGLAQLKRLEAQTATRAENAAYLKSMIKDIPGIVPYKEYDSVTRTSFHLFAFRYKQDGFKGLSREQFLKALRAEGVPCSSGYTPLNTQPYLQETFKTKNFQKGYSKEVLNIKTYNEKNYCPQNELLCKEAVWFTQNMLLGSKNDMEAIAVAVKKIHKNADELKKA